VTSPIANIVANATASLAATSSEQTSTPKKAAGGEMGKDTFLKLLVAQLKYQDPSKPVDSSQFMAQTAQFSMVEKLDEMNTAQQNALSAQLMLAASNLVGRTVSYVDASGMEASGVVTSATISGSSPTVKVGNTDVALSSVKEVRTSAGSGTTA
jgi:flagellar basal-body rod modification protein FlgD